MRRLLQKDWAWVVGVTLIATLSALVAAWIILEPWHSIQDDDGIGLVFYSSTIIATSLAATLFSRELLKPSRAQNRVWSGLILGGLAALSAHLLNGIVSGVIINIIGEGYSTVGEFVEWVYLVAGFGIMELRSSTLIWGIIIGGLLGWLYDRTHPTPETSILNEALVE
ncbi:MAG: hypothetical protein DWQ07_16500 [Chloroflexi bacterium]|nr:MAG: hypothetical protein DWQ07_16500 [Chloroflexota bacterium]MBL1195354.1 hypothetical protein [Chloroflexota bacterium]NOH12638.1 hypothetical protein [Chloroflexota bacterium]